MYDGLGPGATYEWAVDADDGTGSFRPRWFLSLASLFFAPSRALGGCGAMVVLSRMKVEVGRYLPEKNCTLGWRGNCEAYATCLQ